MNKVDLEDIGDNLRTIEELQAAIKVAKKVYFQSKFSNEIVSFKIYKKDALILCRRIYDKNGKHFFLNSTWFTDVDGELIIYSDNETCQLTYKIIKNIKKYKARCLLASQSSDESISIYRSVLKALLQLIDEEEDSFDDIKNLDTKELKELADF